MQVQTQCSWVYNEVHNLYLQKQILREREKKSAPSCLNTSYTQKAFANHQEIQRVTEPPTFETYKKDILLVPLLLSDPPCSPPTRLRDLQARSDHLGHLYVLPEFGGVLRGVRGGPDLEIIGLL
jgi:hypothetical protein